MKKLISFLAASLFCLAQAIPALASAVQVNIYPSDGLPEGWPREGSVVNFTVEFDELVFSFTSDDIVLAGSAMPTTAVVTGNGFTYNVAVSGMSADGLVVINIMDELSFVEYFYNRSLNDGHRTIFIPYVIKPDPLLPGIWLPPLQ